MEKIKSKWRDPSPAAETEKLLDSYYGQLLKWGILLTRGNAGMAQDIVHDLCLHFTLVKPDLSQVANLDGYLYTCLRHIYLSGLARSSREAMQFVSVAEFDSIQFALAATSPDHLVERQNDLRRICHYTVWRKEFSKSASYFILHFFHDCSRREIAEIACLPISAIYNKLKTARTEVKSHLEESGKLRIATRDLPPEPKLLLSPISSAELFSELRETILQAKISECLPEGEILAHYRLANRKPISCSLLSHIVSCERCLSLIDRHFQRPPLEGHESSGGFGSSLVRDDMDDVATHNSSHKARMRAVRRQRDKVYEHRPRTLSIAVNGRITAFHDVQGERSMLSSRIECLEDAHFIEVFSEQQIRMALLPIDERPPEGPHIHTQRVALSDDRWLELTLSFDGLGLHSEVIYLDPALAVAMVDDSGDEEMLAAVSQAQAESCPISDLPGSNREISIFTRVARYFRAMMPTSAPAWAVVLACIFCAAGYFTYLYTRPTLDAKKLLNQSVRIESANLLGQTEHQIVRVEAVSANGQVLQQGMIDLWRDGSGARYIRRLYDAHHRLLAAEWQAKNDQHESYFAKDRRNLSSTDRTLLTNHLWKQDVSSRAFSKLAGRETQIRVTNEGYELTVVGPTKNDPQLISASLVLDRGLHPVRELMRVHNGVKIEEVRFVQADYQRKSSSSVPDATFIPKEQRRTFSDDGPLHSVLSQPRNILGERVPNVRLAQLQIAVLYQLNRLGADTADPIEIVRTLGGRIRISGTVADEARRVQIRSHLLALPDHQLLDLRLISQHSAELQNSGPFRDLSGSTGIYDVGSTKLPAEAILRSYFETKGLTGKRLDSAVAQFSSETLEMAEHALQSSYALDRLGGVLSTAELDFVGPSSQQQWTEMVEKHASYLEAQLDSLNDQLAEISPQGKQQADAGRRVAQIDSPAQFAQATHRLLRQVQNLNHNVGMSFASRASKGEEQNIESLLATTVKAIPLREGKEIGDFAGRLATSERAALERRQYNPDEANVPAAPR